MKKTDLTNPRASFFTCLRYCMENVTLTFISTVPFFVLTIRGWSNSLLIIGSFLSFIFLLLPHDNNYEYKNISLKLKILAISCLAMPILAIIFSSILRNNFSWPELDSASRFLVAISIFLLTIKIRFNAAIVLQYIAPASIIFIFLHQLIFPQPKLWGVERMSTYFADPLVFGYISITLAMMSLVSINLFGKDSIFIIFIKSIGVFLGIYLSIESGSRTGWLSIPVIAIFIAIYKLKIHKNFKATELFTLLAVLLLCLFLLRENQRLILGINEIKDYSWVGMAPETSIGFRITFLRMAFDMFSVNPIYGYGDTAKSVLFLPEQIQSYASPGAINLAFTAGFHNEIITNAIRYGVAGLVSQLMLFVLPLIIFAFGFRNSNLNQKANGFIGISFTLCFLISAQSTEVFDLKYTASFYAILISLLMGSTLVAQTSKDE